MSNTIPVPIDPINLTISDRRAREVVLTSLQATHASLSKNLEGIRATTNAEAAYSPEQLTLVRKGLDLLAADLRAEADIVQGYIDILTAPVPRSIEAPK